MDEPSQSPTEWVERTTVLTAVRLANSRVVQPAAETVLEAQVALTRLFRLIRTRFWHAYGIPTLDEVTVIREQLAALRHRVGSLEQSAAQSSDRREP